MTQAILVDIELIGNMLAACRISELEHLDMTLQQLAAKQLEAPTSDSTPCEPDSSVHASNIAN
jgi:hypothetical protein